MIAIGRDEKLGRIIGSIMPDNRGMQKLCKQLGFRLRHNAQEMLVNAEIEL
jgi:acetyltransferase